MDNDNFQGRLLPGERTLWTGRPADGLLFTGQDIFVIPFSIMWCGFAIFWESGVTHSAHGAPDFFVLWGIPFIAMGLYFVAGRFLVDLWARRCIYYAVTNQRVLILRTPPFSKFTALPIDKLPELSLAERKNGSGTISFVSIWGWNNRRIGIASWSPALDPNPKFLAVPEAVACSTLSSGK